MRDIIPIRHTHLLLRAGRSLWSTAAGLPPGPRAVFPSILPKSIRIEAEGEVPSPIENWRRDGEEDIEVVKR